MELVSKQISRSAALKLVAACAAVLAVSVCDAGNEPCPGAIEFTVQETWFNQEVWTKVGQTECLKCHKAGGDAEETRLVLRDPTTGSRDEVAVTSRHNRTAFAAVAAILSEGTPLILMKVTGGLDHGGKEVLPLDSPGYRILQEFIRRQNGPDATNEEALATDVRPFFAGVTMADDRQLLRRATLSLAGRLPSREELQQVDAGGHQALSEILDNVMKEEAFYGRLREAFNDIFLTLGVDGNPDQTVLSYEHFEKTRGWYQKFDLSHIEDEKERRQAGYKLANEYRAALLDEPMRLIDYIVRNDRPFTEIVTADYIMVSPYSARGYGVYEELKDQFQNPDDPFEYVPVQLKSLVGRSRQEDQERERPLVNRVHYVPRPRHSG